MLPGQGPTGDLLASPADFVPGAPAAFEDTLSFQSECAFLSAAADTPPPPVLQELHAEATPAATLLSAQDQEATRLSLGQQQDFRAGQLFSHADAWFTHLQPSSFVRRWLLDGYSEFLHTLPQAAIRQGNSPSCFKHEAFVDREVQALLACSAIEDVTTVQHDISQVTAVLPLLVAESLNRKDRVCWNGKAINACMDPPTFKLEHAPKAAAMMKPGDYMFTVDMKSGYHQIPLKPSFKRFCCFEWKGAVYRWRVLPFGLSSAPRAYTKLSRCMLAYWRAQGVRVSNYIDDFIFFAASYEEAIALRDRILRDMAMFGWHISLSKSLLNPAQRVLYLGFMLCSVPMCHIYVPAAKIVSLRALLSKTLRRHAAGKLLSGFDIAKVTGTLQSMRFAMAPVNLFTRALYRWQSLLPRDAQGYFVFSHRLPLSAPAVLELQFWERQLAAWNGACLTAGTFSRVLYTDANGSGWGGLVQRVLSRTEEPAQLIASQQWDYIESTDSVFTELQGLHEALLSFAHDLAGTQVLHRTDSLSTYWVVANAGSRRSERLSMLARHIWFICLRHSIGLSSEYVGKDVIIRKGADLLSRWQDDSDCMLQPSLFAWLWERCGPFDVDRFATASNRQSHPVTGSPLAFTSRFMEHGTMGMDALATDWRGTCSYAFPPPSILDRVIQHIAAQCSDTLLICPYWPSQSWWPLLQSLSPSAWRLPSGIQPFLPGRSGCPHPCGRGFANADNLQFYACWIQFP